MIGDDITQIVRDIPDREPLFKVLRSVGVEPNRVSAEDWTDNSVQVFQVDENGKKIQGLNREYLRDTLFFSLEESERWKFALRRVGAL